MAVVEYSVKDAVGLITINRPKALNALNSEVLTALEEVFDTQSRGVRPAPFCCAFFMRFTAVSSRSFSTGRDKKYLPVTVPSGLMAEHTQAWLRPRSTARMVWSCTGVSFRPQVSSKAKSRNHSFPRFRRLGTHSYLPAQWRRI